MLKIKQFLLPLYFIFIILYATVAIAEDWQELSSEHFIAYFTQDKSFTKQVLDKAEVYYRRIAIELGYPRYSQFWLWDNRVKIYIYPDHNSFLKASGQPEWSHGMADYTNRQIVSYRLNKGFLDSLLPHEMAHLIFRDFVGFKGEVPLWLDEGVAQWAEEVNRNKMKAMVKQLYEQDRLLLLDDLTKLNIGIMKEMNRVYIRATRTKEGEPGVLFLSTDNLVSTYYLQSGGLIGFLIERYGSSRFAGFCRQLRDGNSLEEALRFAYPAHIRNLAELEDKWREYLAKE